MLFNSAVLILAAAAAQAIKITSPTNTSTWKTGAAETITWESVETDPSTFTLSIEIPEPFSTVPIAEDVSTSAGSYSYTVDTKYVGDKYRINFVDSKGSGILAQSGYFEIEQGSGAAAGSSSSATGASSVQPAVTNTATSGGSVVFSASNGAATGASASGNIPNASSGTPAGSGAKALVPSIALVAGSFAALLL